jgi:PncC family amidohydrolase
MSTPREIQLGRLLNKNGLSLAVAESCTGGMLGNLITNVPGSSSYFYGGVIAYANKIKMELLGVSANTLESFGAVSRQTVLEMAKGVRAALGADIGLSISGIAGPDGGTAEKPVGTVWIGISDKNTQNAEMFLFSGDRREVKERAAQTAMQIAISYLSGRY